jgi:hypothetical protein
MSNKVLTQYTDITSLPSDALFYTRVSGVSYKTTLGAIESGLGLTVLDLTDTPSSYATIASRSDPSKYYFLSVNSGGDSTEFANVRFTDLTNVPNTIVSMESDSNGQRFLGVVQGASSITAEYVQFTGLEDTPNSYTSAGLKLVRVNSGADALEFVDASSVFTQTTGFTELNDTPNSYAGQAGKYVKVGSSETGLEFTDSISSSSSVKCGETLSMSIPSTSSSASAVDGFPRDRILLQQDNGNFFIYTHWMKPTGFDSGYDITIDLSFIGREHASLNPRYYYNLYCVTGTTGSDPTSFNKAVDAPLLTDYVDTSGLTASSVNLRKSHSFSAALSDDVTALYFCLERTNGTSGAENSSGIEINGIGLTYYQTAS